MSLVRVQPREFKRTVAQFGSAFGLGPKGRRFKSCSSDFRLEHGDKMKTLTPNIQLPDEYFDALVKHSSDFGTSAEQMASQIVQQWIASVLEPNRGKQVSK